MHIRFVFSSAQPSPSLTEEPSGNHATEGTAFIKNRTDFLIGREKSAMKNWYYLREGNMGM